MNDLERLASDELLTIASKFIDGKFALYIPETERMHNTRRKLARLRREHKEFGTKLKAKWEILKNLGKEGIFL